jgi:hypothetical protein
LVSFETIIRHAVARLNRDAASLPARNSFLFIVMARRVRAMT